MTKRRTLRLWTQGDAHVGRDLQFGHTSLSGALSQSEFGSRFNSGLFESFLKNNPGAVDIWFAGHTRSHPDDRKGRRGCFERSYGNTIFIKICVLTLNTVPDKAIPNSWLLTFTTGRDQVCVQYMHTDEYPRRGGMTRRKSG